MLPILQTNLVIKYSNNNNKKKNGEIRTMCFKTKLPKSNPAPQLKIPQQQPIEQQVPTTESGADQATKKKKRSQGNQSRFQIDLSIPTGVSSQGGSASSGPAVR